MKLSTSQSKSIRRLVVILLWLAIWQAAYLAVKKEILLVSPFGVAKAFLALCNDTAFWLSIATSVMRMLFGYIMAIVIGVCAAWLSVKNAVFDEFLKPAMDAIKATPVASFSILALLWLRTGLVPVLMSFLMVFPMVWTNTCQGLRAVDVEYMEMAKIYNFTNRQKFTLIVIPTVAPYLIAALKTGVGMAWKSSVAAEVICTPALSIGKNLYETKLYLETPELFAWTAVVIILSMCIERLFVYIITVIQKKMGFLLYEN